MRSPIAVSEHHASPDGYLPSPLILATAIAARTSTIPITVAALLVPLHDPVRLAEDMAVLDILSRGRVMHIAGLGYRPEEYAMFGRSLAERGRRMEECLAGAAAGVGRRGVRLRRTNRARDAASDDAGRPAADVRRRFEGGRAPRRALRPRLLRADVGARPRADLSRRVCASGSGARDVHDSGAGLRDLGVRRRRRRPGVGADRAVHAARRADVRVVAGRHRGGEQVDRAHDRRVCAPKAGPTASSRPTRRSSTSARTACSRCTRCAAAARPSSRGRRSHLAPRLPPKVSDRPSG